MKNPAVDEQAVDTSNVGKIGASGQSAVAEAASPVKRSEGSARGNADFKRLGRHRSVGWSSSPEP